jgi:ribosome-associated translation inhibitor RaiA
MTYDAIVAILADEAKEYLETAVGDLETYITKLIEAEVNINKSTE